MSNPPPAMYPTPDNPNQQNMQTYPLYPNVNVPYSPQQAAQSPQQGPSYAVPPFDPNNFTVPATTCTLISPDNTTAPLGYGPLIIITTQNPYPASPTITLAISGWELHLPITSARAARVEGWAGGSLYDLSIPPTARLVRLDNSASYVLPTSAGRMRIFIDHTTPPPLLQAFESALGVPRPEQSSTLPRYHEEHKNQLALVGENGEVVGVVAENLHLQDEQTNNVVTADGAEAVVIELDETKLHDPKRASYVQTTQIDGADKPVPIVAHPVRKHAAQILSTADYMSSGIVTASSVIGTGIINASEALKKHITPSEKEHTVSPSVLNAMKNANEFTGKTAKVTKTAVNTLFDVAMAVGQKAGSSLRRKPKEGAPPKQNSAGWELLMSTAQAAVTVLDAGMEGAKSIARDTATATHSLLRHKYGDQVADAFYHSAGTIGNIGLVYFDAKGVSKRAFIKKAAKEAVLSVRMKDGRVARLGVKEGEGGQQVVDAGGKDGGVAQGKVKGGLGSTGELSGAKAAESAGGSPSVGSPYAGPAGSPYGAPVGSPYPGPAGNPYAGSVSKQ
ncbi:hypothetical protein HDV00_005720 [Rhizophlyctis rosea]|nr:hypothetical protein HDV00_005720 [Rhizophlyctis rosea]